MTKNIRLATLEDGVKIQNLILRAYEPIRQLGINFAAATADLNLVEKNIKNNMCYVLEEDGELLATCSLRMPWGLQPGPYGFPHIYWFAVDPKIGKQGVGATLLKWVEENIVRDTLKSPAVTLGTADKHPWLVNMYEKKGYERVGTADLGRGHITIYLRKILLKELFDEIVENNKAKKQKEI